MDWYHHTAHVRHSISRSHHKVNKQRIATAIFKKNYEWFDFATKPNECHNRVHFAELSQFNYVKVSVSPRAKIRSDGVITSIFPANSISRWPKPHLKFKPSVMPRYLKKSPLKNHITTRLKRRLLLACIFLAALNFKTEATTAPVGTHPYCTHTYAPAPMKGVMPCPVCCEDSLFVSNVKGLSESPSIAYDSTADSNLFLANYIVIGLIVIVMYLKLPPAQL